MDTDIGEPMDIIKINNTNKDKIIMRLENPRMINLYKHLDRRGNISVVEEITDIPFKIARTYWIYDVPGGVVRGGHSYRRNREFIIALSGSFDIALDNGSSTKIFSLNRSYYGLYIPKGYWRQIQNFSTNSLALILASTNYNPDDYIYDYSNFKNMLNEEDYYI